MFGPDLRADKAAMGTTNASMEGEKRPEDGGVQSRSLSGATGIEK